MMADSPERMDFLRLAHAQRPLSRHGYRTDYALRSQGNVPFDGRDQLRRRHVGSRRRPPRPIWHYPRLCQGRQETWRRNHTAEPRRRTDAGIRTAPGMSSPNKARSKPSMSSTAAGCGRAKSAAWLAWNCRSLPWSTCISLPSDAGGHGIQQGNRPRMIGVMDFKGEIYTRQERNGILLGTYEKPQSRGHRSTRPGISVTNCWHRTSTASPLRWRSVSSIFPASRRLASSRSSTARSPSRPTATRLWDRSWG